MLWEMAAGTTSRFRATLATAAMAAVSVSTPGSAAKITVSAARNGRTARDWYPRARQC
jgi:hypothetical protein